MKIKNITSSFGITLHGQTVGSPEVDKNKVLLWFPLIIL